MTSSISLLGVVEPETLKIIVALDPNMWIWHTRDSGFKRSKKREMYKFIVLFAFAVVCANSFKLSSTRHAGFSLRMSEGECL